MYTLRIAPDFFFWFSSKTYFRKCTGAPLPLGLTASVFGVSDFEVQFWWGPGGLLKTDLPEIMHFSIQGYVLQLFIFGGPLLAKFYL